MTINSCFSGLTKRIMVEIQIMSWIGIFFAVLGFIGAIVYTRTLTKSRWAGLLACISLSFSGITKYLYHLYTQRSFFIFLIFFLTIYFAENSMQKWVSVLACENLACYSYNGGIAFFFISCVLKLKHFY